MKKIIIFVALAIFAIPANAQKIWTLQECIDYAKSHNLTVQMQALSEQNQAIRLNSAKNQRLPNLNASASNNWSFGRGASPVDNSYQSINSMSSSLSISTSVPLFTGFQISNEIAATKLDLQAAVADLEKAKEDIELSVISAYLQILYNKELVVIAQNQVDLSREQLTRIEGLFDAGKASEAQLYEVQAQIANDELSVVQAQSDLQLAILALTQLLELSSPEGFDIAKPDDETKYWIPSNPENVYNNALTNRASVRAGEYRIASSERSVKVARSGYYPQLSFGAGYGNNYYRLHGASNSSFRNQIENNGSEYFGFSLSIPIFNRFQTRNNIRSAKLNVKNEQLQLENTKKTLYKEIQQAHYNAVASGEKLKSSEKALQSMEKAYNFAKEKFENGRATSYEFSDAKNNLTRASANVAQAKYDYFFRKKILDFYNGLNE